MKPELIRWRVALRGEKQKGLFKVRLNNAEINATKSGSDQPGQKIALMQACTMSKKEKESYPPSVGRNASSIDLGFEPGSG